MLTTVQPALVGSFKCVFRAGEVVELALRSSLEDEQTQDRFVVVLREVEPGDVAVGVAGGEDRSATVRLQIRIGFCGPRRAIVGPSALCVIVPPWSLLGTVSVDGLPDHSLARMR